jgi:hypothetical protein
LSGVLFGDAGAVARGLGCAGRGRREDERAEGGVSGAEEVDAAFSELFHEVAGVQVLSGAVSGGKPGARARRGWLAVFMMLLRSSNPAWAYRRNESHMALSKGLSKRFVWGRHVRP